MKVKGREREREKSWRKNILYIDVDLFFRKYSNFLSVFSFLLPPLCLCLCRLHFPSISHSLSLFFFFCYSTLFHDPSSLFVHMVSQYEPRKKQSRSSLTTSIEKNIITENTSYNINNNKNNYTPFIIIFTDTWVVSGGRLVHVFFTTYSWCIHVPPLLFTRGIIFSVYN